LTLFFIQGLIGNSWAQEFEKEEYIEIPFEQFNSGHNQFEITYDGKLTRFHSIPNNSISEKLKRKYTKLETYDLIPVQNELIRGKMVKFDTLVTFFIKNRNDIKVYSNRGKIKSKFRLINETEPNESFSCGVQSLINNYSTVNRNLSNTLNGSSSNLRFGDQLGLVELVVVTTGEFHQENGSNINTSMMIIAESCNYINSIYENELSIKFTLVDCHVFLDSMTDPFIPDSSSGDIRPNQATEVIASIWDNSEYDIGHVFHTDKNDDNWSNGGQAYLGGVCDDSENLSLDFDSIPDGLNGPNKAAAWSGYNNNDSLMWYRILAHEIGHQLGASHTFNGIGSSCSGQHSIESAVEIGSGTTIMSYLGLCNIEQNIVDSDSLDNYFHVHSLGQIKDKLNSVSCIEYSISGNIPPICEEFTEYSSLTIPGSTPFEFISDSNNDNLFTSWEQIDISTSSTQGLIGILASTSAEGPPLFRSFPPNIKNSRSFPSIDFILQGDNNSPPFTTLPNQLNFETLPSISRQLNFAFTTRAYYSDGGGFCSSSFDIGVDGTSGPFQIISPNVFMILNGDGISTMEFQWNVMNTDNSVVNCQEVDILASVDNGLSFPYLLKSNTPNDGIESILIPNLQSDELRFKIRSSSNIFFDINDEIISINSTCQANGSSISPTDTIVAERFDSNLNLSLSPDNSSAPSGFNYSFIVVDNVNNIIVSVEADPDLTFFPTGVYSVYGISFDQNMNLELFCNVPFNDLLNQILSFQSCAQLSSNSIYIKILEPSVNIQIPIIAYEYWFDDQNATSNRNGFSFAPTTDYEFDFELQTSNLERGEHTLHYRVQDQSGKWSTIQSQTFFKTETGDKDIVAREYWYDGQNEESNRIGLSFSPTDDYTFDNEIITSLLENGEHTLHYRSQDISGTWSTIQSKKFTKSEEGDYNIVAYEYWYDGVNGNSDRIGQSVGQTKDYELNAILSTNALSRNEHTLHYRTQNVQGEWSTVLSKSFQKQNENDNDIIEYEYWINNELPSNSITINSTQNYTLDETLNLPAIDSANYAFKIRFKDELGRWSTIFEDSVLIDMQPILCNDTCYIEYGTTSPCLTFIDTDGDGTCDFNDGCPSDPNKIAPGNCDCGAADTDTDQDGTPDCDDLCPNDSNKIVPGDCGCGIPDTDTDQDGTADCNDGCPNDPNKIALGDCGCGVADTDTDQDGIADCNDDCPNDPNKIAPGDCGCGIADTDTDQDGTADCNDGWLRISR